MLRYSVLILFLTGFAYGDGPEPPKAAGSIPTVKVPATITVAVGERFTVKPIVTNGGAVKWYCPDSAALAEDRTFLDLVPIDVKEKLTGRMFYSDTPGRFRIVVYCAGENKIASDEAICTVTVGNAPEPLPPGPIPPVPVPPVPDLSASLAAAYKTDGSPAPQAKALASLYRLGSTSTVNDASLTTLDALVAVMHTAADSLLKPSTGTRVLSATRDVLKADLASKVGTKPGTPLDPALRKTLADQFNRYAGLIESLAK